MIIPDTSVWIEFLKGNEPYFSQLKELLERNEVMGVECIFGELLQGAKNSRERNSIESYWKYLPKSDEHGFWIEAGRYSGELKLSSRGIGLIDAVLLIASRTTKARLWTPDKKLRSVLENEE